MQKPSAPAAGSYAFDRMARNAEELNRLKLQATVALSLERKIWEASGLKVGMQVLDLGCGPGFISCELAKYVGGGSVTGFDISEQLIAVAAQAKNMEQTGNVAFRHGNLYDLDLAPDSFDFVYARFVFQHLEQPRLALRNIMRVLKPGGRLCVLDIDDNWTSFSPDSDAFVKFIRKAGAGQHRKGGNRLIGSQLYGLLCQSGMTDVSTTIHPLTTEDLDMRMFLGVAVYFRLQILNKLRQMRVWPQLRRIKAAAMYPHAWGAIGIFASTGTKPKA